MLLSQLIEYLKGRGVQVNPNQVAYAQSMGYIQKPIKDAMGHYDYSAYAGQYMEYFQTPRHERRPD